MSAEIRRLPSFAEPLSFVARRTARATRHRRQTRRRLNHPARPDHQTHVRLAGCGEKVELPFGYEISVVQAPPDKDDRAAEWDVDNRTIVVDRRLPPAEKRGAFLHELDHAWSDWKLWVAQNVPVKYPDAMDPDPAEQDEDGVPDAAPQEGV